ncbi:hypothetical protein CHS0354_015996 [Potamilus streckersoni]|uniref:Uncharacterized protein n=1 Tax=Potamilus streckersoni TaxID=2493646 RepID=A0AAE0SY86_9BIVA|nr:hypothetical protein CHS0354_015996 [Potamilus streckersoni]
MNDTNAFVDVTVSNDDSGEKKGGPGLKITHRVGDVKMPLQFADTKSRAKAQARSQKLIHFQVTSAVILPAGRPMYGLCSIEFQSRTSGIEPDLPANCLAVNHSQYLCTKDDSVTPNTMTVNFRFVPNGDPINLILGMNNATFQTSRDEVACTNNLNGLGGANKTVADTINYTANAVGKCGGRADNGNVSII